MIVNNDFKDRLHNNLIDQLTDGYPCDISKEFIIKDIEEIVLLTMQEWANRDIEGDTDVRSND